MSEEIERNLLSVTEDKIILDGFTKLNDTIVFQILSSSKGLVIYPKNDPNDTYNKIISKVTTSNGTKICNDKNAINALKEIDFNSGYFLFFNDRYHQMA